MELPKNKFKAALKRKEQQIGLWSCIPDTTAAEVIAGSNFDWILFDTEHSPADPVNVLPILQAVAPYTVTPIVRPAANDPVLIKRFLDIGVQTLLIPMVQSREEAENAVAAIRYPPRGIRGVAGTTRATRFGRISGYSERAEEELCLLLQIETQAGLTALDEIAQTDGVDGVFIGPGDLAASLGFPGQTRHPEVVQAIERALKRLVELGVPPGILTPDIEFAKQCITNGTLFTAVGQDIGVLARETEKLRATFEN
ncbi:MAG: aldolase/citrate lyase family protein [Boseongicola sp.]